MFQFKQVNTVGIIIDTDMASDAGDVGAVQVAIALSRSGEANILAVVTNTSNLKSAPAARVLLNVNSFSSIPVGAYMGNDMPAGGTMSGDIVARFGMPPTDTRSNYPDATTLLRTVLASAANGSVTYVTIGLGANIQALLQSPADVISGLNGSQLFLQKVNKLVVMGGEYPTGTEFNFQQSAAAWNYIFANKPAVPTYLMGFSVGATVFSGPAVNGGEFVSPSYYAYSLQGGFRPDWDQLAVLYAVRGLGASFSIVGANGTNSVNASTGANTWTSTPGNDSYLGKVMSDGALGTIVTNLMAGVL